MIWEVDLYRRPLQDEVGQPVWELLVCDTAFVFTYGATIPQSQVNTQWIQTQLQIALDKAPERPDIIRVFRPQAFSLLQVAAQSLDLVVQAKRYTPTLKQWLVQRSKWYPTQPNYVANGVYDPLAIESPVPNPIPEYLWGEQWRFGSLSAQNFQENLRHEPIPVQAVPEDWLPLHVGLSSQTMIPGLIVDAGRRAMALAQWLQTQAPAFLSYVPGAPDGMVMAAGLVERWILLTFEDPEVRAAALSFTQRLQQAQGLHFLLVRPDDSGMTFTGLWLLRSSRES